MSNFAPGPWEIVRDERDKREQAKWQFGLKGDDGFWVATVQVHYRSDDEIRNANASLIAAAPEMYEALKGWQDHLAESFNCMDAKEQAIYLKAKAALAKAEARHA